MGAREAATHGGPARSRPTERRPQARRQISGERREWLGASLVCECVRVDALRVCGPAEMGGRAERANTFPWLAPGQPGCGAPRRAPSFKWKPLLLALSNMLPLLLLTTNFKLAQSSMCQHHQALMEAAAAAAPTSASQQPPTGAQNLVVCPVSSQYNNLPQFPPKFVSPNLERQQREILKHLNASFASHLQLNGQSGGLEPQAGAAQSPGELIDDELLNEIISPIVVDAAYERAKELIVKRRKLENELVRQGESECSKVEQKAHPT